MVIVLMNTDTVVKLFCYKYNENEDCIEKNSAVVKDWIVIVNCLFVLYCNCLLFISIQSLYRYEQ